MWIEGGKSERINEKIYIIYYFIIKRWTGDGQMSPVYHFPSRSDTEETELCRPFIIKKKK
jgi:hypothetical protein